MSAKPIDFKERRETYRTNGGTGSDQSDQRPQNLEAEGAILKYAFSGDVLEEAFEGLRSDDFYREAHKLVWQARERAQQTATEGEPVGFVEIYDALMDAGHVGPGKTFETSAEIQALWRDYPGSIFSWVRAVKRRARQRRMLDRAQKLAIAAVNDFDNLRPFMRQLAEESEEDLRGTATAGRYQFLTFSQLMDLPDQEYVVGKLLPEDAISVTYAESGIGKTFTWLDIALCMAFGLGTWHGLEIKPGAVAYIAAEGGRGIKKRVQAWCQFHGLQWSDDIPFYPLPKAVPLLQEECVAELGDAIRALPQKPQVIVIDTLARSMDGGDENLAKDINSVFAAAGRLREINGGHVAIIHHTGKDAAKGGRGSYALKGNADTELYFTAQDGCIQITNSKQKEDEKFDPILLKLQKVWLDADMTRSSCVVVDAAGTEKPTPVQPATGAQLTTNEHTALAALAGFEQGARNADWHRASGIKAGSSFDEARKALIARQMAYLSTIAGKQFYRITDLGRQALGLLTITTPLHSRTTPIGANGASQTTPLHSNNPIGLEWSGVNGAGPSYEWSVPEEGSGES